MPDQDDLFGSLLDESTVKPEAETPPAPTAQPTRPSRAQAVQPAASLLGADLAPQLPPGLRMGTSSWAYPGWEGLVWGKAYSDRILSQRGLTAYSQHPLLAAVGIDRSFYRPLTASEYAVYAAQVPAGFRFVVKGPALVCDAQVRGEEGRAREPNPAFLDPSLALDTFVRPALDGLGAALGVLLFQLSPLPIGRALDLRPTLAALEPMLHAAVGAVRAAGSQAIVAVEVRDADWIQPPFGTAFAELLRASGAVYGLGLHAKMPRIAEQLPLLRSLWPCPLVARWNLNPLFGPYGYEEAGRIHAPYDRIQHPDEATLQALARTALGIAAAGQPAYVIVSNEAEGCAPQSIVRLAQAIIQRKNNG
ncbi:hypothetical protein GCM10027082_27040 [Comamonas humi]